MLVYDGLVEQMVDGDASMVETKTSHSSSLATTGGTWFMNNMCLSRKGSDVKNWFHKGNGA